MTRNNISYKELYELIDLRFTRFEEKLDNRFEDMDQRIAKLTDDFTKHVRRTDEKFMDLTLFKHRVLWYFSLAFTAIAFAINMVSGWIKKQLGIV